MAGYVNGGMATLPAASTANVLNSTGFDRLLVIHLNTVSANTLGIWKNSTGLVAITTGLSLLANDVRDVGPYFFGSTENLVGGAATSSGTYLIDEMRL